MTVPLTESGEADVEDLGMDDLPVLEFVAPMPGFPELRRFVLVRVDEDGLLYSLAAIDDQAVRFLVAPPAPFFPDYTPEVDDEALATLGGPAADDLLLLVVISTGDTPQDATANLMAPIVIAQAARKLAQVIQSGSGLPTRAPLFQT